MLRQVELSVGRPPDPAWKRPPGRPRTNGSTNSAAITTMFPLRLSGGKLLVVVTRERRYGPSRLRVNDDDGKRKFELQLHLTLSSEVAFDQRDSKLLSLPHGISKHLHCISRLT